MKVFNDKLKSKRIYKKIFKYLRRKKMSFSSQELILQKTIITYIQILLFFLKITYKQVINNPHFCEIIQIINSKNTLDKKKIIFSNYFSSDELNSITSLILNKKIFDLFSDFINDQKIIKKTSLTKVKRDSLKKVFYSLPLLFLMSHKCNKKKSYDKINDLDIENTEKFLQINNYVQKNLSVIFPAHCNFLIIFINTLTYI